MSWFQSLVTVIVIVVDPLDVEDAWFGCKRKREGERE